MTPSGMLAARRSTVLLLLSLLFVSGCSGQNPLDMIRGGGGSSGSSSQGSSSSSSGSSKSAGEQASGAPAGPIKAGETFKAKEQSRLLILPGKTHGPPPPVPGITRAQCKDLTDGGPVKGPDCVTGEIKCGQTIIGATQGGLSDNHFSTRFYEKFFCTPATTHHDGGSERVYHFHAPPGKKRLWFTLDTPCTDLDMAVMRWDDTQKCPTLDSNVVDCDMWPKDGTKREVVDMTSTGESDWLVVVEGKDNNEGAFAVTAQCVDW